MTLRYKTLDFLSICSPQVREMYEHWAALRGERVLPHRDDLDPAQITRYLPGIMLVDVQWGPPLDFVYRLVGTREVESRGGRVLGSVTKELRYLVIADVESTSTKAEKARKLGTKLITEDQLFELIAEREAATKST